ncbi:hypothetical protein PF003_g20865 [Phytophthora fragariae]|nr:hypothetical protein PF003_g20865 [Phytophthora fragariae]
MGFCCVGSCACSVLCRCGVVLAKQQWKAEIRGKLSDATVESYSTNCPRSQCSVFDGCSVSSISTTGMAN